MLLSSCCKNMICVKDTENGGYYACNACHLPCRILTVLCLSDMNELFYEANNLEKSPEANSESKQLASPARLSGGDSLPCGESLCADYANTY